MNDFIESHDFFADISSWTRPPLCEKSGGRPSNQANKQLVAKASLSVFPQILTELPLVRDISFNINIWKLPMRLK